MPISKDKKIERLVKGHDTSVRAHNRADLDMFMGHNTEVALKKKEGYAKAVTKIEKALKNMDAGQHIPAYELGNAGDIHTHLHNFEQSLSDHAKDIGKMHTAINDAKQVNEELHRMVNTPKPKFKMPIAGKVGVGLAGAGLLYGGYKMLTGHKKHAELSLQKLGEAVYIHRKNIERAELAKQAVEYLDSKGVFADDDKNN